MMIALLPLETIGSAAFFFTAKLIISMSFWSQYEIA
jgi:hypothetical protein